MNEEQYLLQCLQEEAAEVIHAASKCNRFGLESTNPEYQIDNRQHLENEVGDLMGVLKILYKRTIIRMPPSYIELFKEKKVLDSIELAREFGTVDGPKHE